MHEDFMNERNPKKLFKEPLILKTLLEQIFIFWKSNLIATKIYNQTVKNHTNLH